MELQINKDPQDLNKSAFGGRKWWQYACIVGAVLIAVIFTLFFQAYLGNTLNSIICAILVVPLGYIGIFKKNGLNFFEYHKKKHSKTGNVFLYVSVPVKYKETDTNKKHGFKYYAINLITGGKYVD